MSVSRFVMNPQIREGLRIARLAQTRQRRVAHLRDSPLPYLMTPRAVAFHCGMSRAWVYREISDGSIPIVSGPTGRMAVRREDFLAFVDRCGAKQYRNVR